MANRRPQNNGRRVDYGRNDRGKNFGRPGVSPWLGGGPGASVPNLLPLGGGSTEATLALANNLINNLLLSRQPTVPSLLDMPIRQEYPPNRFDHGGYSGPNRMGSQGNFRRSGNYNRPYDRMNNRKPFKPSDGQRSQNRTTPKKEADSRTKPVKESAPVKTVGDSNETVTDNAEGGQEKKEVPKTHYDDINPQLLKCHICNKSMWDGRSFENHLGGRAHSIMMQKTAESYALTADTMRQEFKIREMKRTRKTGQATPRDFYCAMCDIYAANGAAHRPTVGHCKLKKFLHPACSTCRKEMPTRIELDEHRLTAEHLRNVQDKHEITAKPEVMVISTLSIEQSYVRGDRQRRNKPKEGNNAPSTKETEGEGEQVQNETEPKEGEDAEMQPETSEEDTKVLDFNEEDDLSHVTADMIPDYNTARGVGHSFLSPFSCVQCRLCHKLLDSQETAEVHLKTRRHHQLFVRALKEKSGQGTFEQGTSEQGTSEQAESSKRFNSEREESGNWKRRKTSPEHDDENDEEEDFKMTEEPLNQVEADADINIPIEEDGTETAGVEAEVKDADESESKIDEDPEQNGNQDDQFEDPQPEATPVKEKSPPPSPEVTTDAKPKPKPTPRGRGRGRARGRGRN